MFKTALKSNGFKFFLIACAACVLLGSIFTGCSDAEREVEKSVENSLERTVKKSYSVEDFSNILNVKNIPVRSKDWKSFCMSDHGAWFGFGLPGDASVGHYGSFPGPFVMTVGRWLSDRPAAFYMSEPSDGKRIDYSKALSRNISYYPGRLTQHYEFSNFKTHLQLIFVSSSTAVIKTSIVNTSSSPIRFDCGWEGGVLDFPVEVKALDGGVRYSFEKPKTDKTYSFLVKSLNHEVSVAMPAEKQYRLAVDKTIEIAPGGKESVFLLLSYLMTTEEEPEVSALHQQIAGNPESYFDRNLARWNSYLNRVLTCDSRWSQESAYRNIAVKALLTLVNNWRCAYGDLLYDGLFPSYAVSYFNGFWAWDSWKHSVAIARFDTELAKNQIRTMFALQDEHGMVPDVIYSNKSWNNRRDTKPPLASWSVWEVYEQSGDTAFVKEMFPLLMRYHRWWYLNRDHDKNGLCEYGSTDGTLVAALWESGMDDAVRFDNRKMLKNNDRAWSMNVESVDLNAYLFADKRYLSKMARLLGDNETAIMLDQEAEALKKKIQDMMFNKDSGFFHDINLEDKSFLEAQGPEGWIPLWANAATAQQAESVKNVICDPDKFATFIPFPTISKDNKKFNTGYWRGAVWLDQAYFCVKGLRNYGFDKEADMFTRHLFDRPEGLKNSDKPIRENYDPVTGKGLKVNHFSWSSAHYLLLFWVE